MYLNPDTLPKEDILNRSEFANQIAKSLAKTTGHEADGFVVSLTGKWGSGKTSLLSYLKNGLKTECDLLNINHAFIEFNPWVFADNENIKIAFLKEFVNQLKDRKRPIFKKIVGWFSSGLENLDAVNGTLGKIGKPLGKMIRRYIDSNSSLRIKRNIDRILFRANKKIFVFIDDIDRLSPKQVFEILQMLKLTCNFKNTYYIVAYDKEAVEASIETQFHDYGKKYLDKIVQADFLIPEVADEKIESIFFSRLETLCNDYKISYSSSQLSSIWLHYGLRRYFSTLRDIYRYFNSLQFSLPIISDEIDITDFLILETIRLHDFGAYQKIQTDFALSAFTLGAEIKLGSDEHIKTFENDITKKLVKYLFPQVVGSFGRNKGKRLFDTKYFERYFTLKVSSKDITELEFVKFMQPGSERKSILENILQLNRLENLLVRLNDKEISEQQKTWDFDLIKDLYDFFSQNANRLTAVRTQLADSIINLLSADLKKRDAYFNSFIDLLVNNYPGIDYARIYFLHFMLLSKVRDSGFPHRAEEFKEFYLERYEKLQEFYLPYLDKWKNYFMANVINEPLNYCTSLFFYDYATFLPEPYEVLVDELLGRNENLVFFLRNVLSINSEEEAYGIEVNLVKLLLPGVARINFLERLKYVDITRLDDIQRQWREFYLDNIDVVFSEE